MRKDKPVVTIAALTFLAASTGVTTASASVATGPRAVQHVGATLRSSGHASTGQSVKVTVTLTLPHGDKFARYTFDFGDHTKTVTGSKLPSSARHTYFRAGRYVVTFVATDRLHVSRRAKLTEAITGKTMQASGSPGGDATTMDPGTSPGGLPNPPAGCNGTSSPGVNVFNTTPVGGGPWTVPRDLCNSEGVGGSDDDIYADGDYWGAEKRPDIWANAVLKYGYGASPYGPWNVDIDAAKAGYPIDATPRVGDLAAWNDDTVMGTDSTGTEQDAGPGGQVAYVEAVNPDGSIVISEMGAGAEDGGYTYTLTYSLGTSFIHQI